MHGKADVGPGVGHPAGALRDSFRFPVRVPVLFLSLIVSFLMLSSLFFPMSERVATIDSPLADSSDLIDEISAPMSSTGTSPRSHWDWEQLADDDGLVSVIVKRTASIERTSSSDDSVSKADGLLAEFAARSTRTFSLAFDGFSAKVELESLKALQELGYQGFEVYPDITVHATLTESVYQIGADQVWMMKDAQGQYVTGKGIVVAVIDTGVAYNHPDLGGGFGPSYKVIGGYDFYNEDSDPMDDNGHGTHVAGIVAAKGGITGVAPDAQILAYKVLGADGSGPMSNVLAAIERAIDPNSDGLTDDHADVISMSLGGPGEVDDPACDAVLEAVQAGVMVVVAAGNDGPSMGTVASPGISPDALTVGALDRDDSLAEFSSRGTGPGGNIKPEISAPGVLITSTVPFSGATRSSSTGYSSMSGTSMATPHVSGAAALLIQLHPTWTPAQVKSAIVSGSYAIDESLWSAGAGGLWVPGGAAATMFFEPAIVSYGFAGESSSTASVVNLGPSITTTIDASDWLSLSADGSAKSHDWVNVSSVSPTSMTLASGQSGSLQLTVPVPAQDSPEGYFDGRIELSSTLGRNARLPFGFVVLSVLNVHVMDMAGREVFDPYGGVWVYGIPEPNVALSCRGSPSDTAPPAKFLLPSGDYSVHAIGHQSIYEYVDPYVLSSTVNLPRVSTLDVYLTMVTARVLTLDLKTEDGVPIFVKDYRAYVRHEASTNVSFHLVGIDYSISGEEIFSLPTSKPVYVSDTEATVGISIAGYSYSAGLWDFMKRNWRHIYEYPLSTTCGFYIEADADIQYLLSWEYDGIDSATPSVLGLVDGRYSVHETKYDIPGALDSYWSLGGTHQSAGGEANFFVRRDHYTSMNPFFSGMTRTLVVQGVYSSLYFPGSPYGGFIEREFYVPDYSELVRADSVSEIYLPSRVFLTEPSAAQTVARVGSGPFYPAIMTANTNASLVLFQPLLRDQSGAKVVGIEYPQINLYKNSQFVGLYQVAEYMARPDAMRIIDLMGPGSYVASIGAGVMNGANDHVTIDLKFTIPSADIDPPAITGLTMSQRFLPGSLLPLEFTASDTSGSITAEAWWRGSPTEPWTTIALNIVAGTFSGAIQTRTTDSALDLRLKVSDSSGNYIDYVAGNASTRQIATRFALTASPAEVGYRNGDASVQLSGYLTDSSGLPLHSLVAVPIDLGFNGRKIGTILDDYVSGTVHSHNGTILFDWHFNPTSIFTGPDQYAEIDVDFDLGIYQPQSTTIVLRSIEYTNDIPVISLVSPSNGSLIAGGSIVDIAITDSGTVTAEAYLDGLLLSGFTAPWDLNTGSWSSGVHVLRIVAVDDQLAESEASFMFEVDGTYPSLSIIQPLDGSMVPAGWVLEIAAQDEHLVSVSFSLDGAPFLQIAPPYRVNMTGWAVGIHTVVVEALDSVGHRSTDSVMFEIVEGSLVVALVSPADGSVIRSGVPIDFSVLSFGTPTSRWSEDGVWHNLGDTTLIPTDGWTDGLHVVTINATDDLGGFDDLVVTVVIDNTLPVISLLSPVDGSFVALGTKVTISVADANFDHTTTTLWGQEIPSYHATTSIVLMNAPADGHFTLAVRSYDKAGNEGTASFVFAMDSAPPILAVSGFVSGDAIRPNQQLTIEASDVFLSYVRYSFDSADMTTIGYPYQVGTDSLSSGWHVLSIVAGDYSGKTSSLDMSVYLDATPPQIEPSVPASVDANSVFDLDASITDDYSVESALLFYQLQDGSYSSIVMAGTDSEFSTRLPAEAVVWDGMTIYIRACDSVGNWAESVKLTIHVATDSTDDSITPGGSSGFMDLSWLTSTTGMAVICSGIGFLVLSLAVVKRNRKDSPEEPPPIWGSSSTRKAVETRMMEMHDAPRIPEPFQEEQPVIRQPPPVQAPPAVVAKVEPQVPKPKPPTLIDTMPSVPIKIQSQSDDGMKEEEIDYGDLIERELIIPGLKRSIFEEDVKALEKEFGLDTDVRDPRLRPPKPPLGR